MNAITIKNARKVYANGFEALKGMSFEVPEGMFFGLLGPNGAGKTTLISAMAGLARLTSGEIQIMGHDVRQEAYQARMNLGVVPQELVFDPFFTVREALRIQSGYFGIKQNDAWIDEILHHLDLLDKADTNTRNLSGGMKRRVMVAQALVHRPPVIVLDEPTAGVDVELRQSLWMFMRSLNQQGHTIILTTHYLEEAEAHCERIAVMKEGRLIALDDTARLLANEQGVRLALRLAAPLSACWQEMLAEPPSDGGRHVILRLKDYAAVAEVIQALQQEGNEIREMRILEQDLEQVFLSLTGAGMAQEEGK